jgi:hypothetical protein
MSRMTKNELLDSARELLDFCSWRAMEVFEVGATLSLPVWEYPLVEQALEELAERGDIVKEADGTFHAVEQTSPPPHGLMEVF